MNDLFFHSRFLLDHIKKAGYSIAGSFQPVQVFDIPRNVFCNSNRCDNYCNNNNGMQDSFKFDGCFHDAYFLGYNFWYDLFY